MPCRSWWYQAWSKCFKLHSAQSASESDTPMHIHGGGLRCHDSEVVPCEQEHRLLWQACCRSQVLESPGKPGNAKKPHSTKFDRAAGDWPLQLIVQRSVLLSSLQYAPSKYPYSDRKYHRANTNWKWVILHTCIPLVRTLCCMHFQSRVTYLHKEGNWALQKTHTRTLHSSQA